MSFQSVPTAGTRQWDVKGQALNNSIQRNLQMEILNITATISHLKDLDGFGEVNLPWSSKCIYAMYLKNMHLCLKKKSEWMARNEHVQQYGQCLMQTRCKTAQSFYRITHSRTYYVSTTIIRTMILPQL